MQVEVKDGPKGQGKNLVVSIPLNDPPRISKSGKTLLVASTGGFVRTTTVVNGKPISVSVNATVEVDE